MGKRPRTLLGNSEPSDLSGYVTAGKNGKRISHGLAQIFTDIGGKMGEKLDCIVINPGICLGQPTIRDTRITVSVILKMLAGGKSIEEVIEAYHTADL